MPYLLGIDVGTSGVKSALFDPNGKTVTSSFQPYSLLTPHPGWAEQNPEDWWVATVKSIREILKKVNLFKTKISGIGLSGQMHGSVFLDKLGNVIRPCILWCDGRTEEQCNFMTHKIGQKRLHKYTSNKVLTGFTAPKIIWLQQKEPKHFDKIHTICLPKDYIRYKLTGELACDISDAAGTLLFDVQNKKWSNEVLRALDIPGAWLPPVYGSSEICGKITRQISQLTGLESGIPVVAGGADNTCGAIGTGVVKEGCILSSIGSSGVIFAPTKKIKVDPLERVHTFNHSVPGLWYLMGCMLSAGLSFRWFRDNLGGEELKQAKKEGIDPYQVLIREAQKSPVGSEGLQFLPYLMGERSPHGNPNARGVYYGLSIRHQKSHMVRALLEGVTFGLRDSLEIISNLKVPVREIRATGGGAKSNFWCQLQADIFGHEVVTINSSEGPALGAALLAGVGTGMYQSIQEACDNVVKINKTYEPDLKKHKEYNEWYQVYQSLYPVLKNSFSQNAKMVEKYS